MVRCVLGLVATVLAAGACDDGKHHLHPEAGRDAPPPPWWQPQSGTAKDWDIQLVDPIDVSMTRVMYDLDLWGLVPAATMLDYGDGMPVAVKMGANAGKIAELKGRGVKVICHVDTGALTLDAPDAMKFPGYEANPPDDPGPVKAGSVIGFSIDPMNPNRRLLDISMAGRAKWTKYMFKRFDLAKQIGCDGIDADYNDFVAARSGFTVSVSEQFSWYADLVKQLHDRELSAGMHTINMVPDLVDTTAQDFDWMMIDRCGENDDCDRSRPFLDKRRVVFAVDYVNDITGAPQNQDLLCSHQQKWQVSEGLVKDNPPSKTVRRQCTP